MSPDLSIIIPCYNSEKTLAKAVSSIFDQNLKISFEVVIVDDGSTDTTSFLIKDLCKSHREIKAVFHNKNMGGGVARNTAVKTSKGKIIFCLDSDDILGSNMLAPMYNMIISRKLDGVGVNISKKFIGDNIERIAYINTFGYVDQIIPFESLFEGATCSLYSTFMFSRKAFNICGGYPTEHGFDTQGFAFRFLANNLKASTCEGTVYFHRVNFNQSYYLREYEAGRASQNTMKYLEEFLYFFSENAQKLLLSQDVHNSSISIQQLLIEMTDRFRPNYRSYIRRNTREVYRKTLLGQKELTNLEKYWLGCYLLEKKKYVKALQYFTAAYQDDLNVDQVKDKVIITLSKLLNISQNDLKIMCTMTESNLRNKIKFALIKAKIRLARLLRKFI